MYRLTLVRQLRLNDRSTSTRQLIKGLTDVTVTVTRDVKASRPDWPKFLPRPRAFGLGLASVLLIWVRKMCYSMKSNIGRIHFVVVSLQHSLQRRD